ncbi:MAG: hypothetical protein AAFO03_20470 [Bacteroidota bacterium]
MKTYKGLFEQIISFENLLQAAKRSQRGRRFKPNVAAFHQRLEEEVLTLQSSLRDKSYRPGGYRTFHIYDPKKRMISAAPYHDRVVHHALCQITEPLFERTFVYDSYANRKGKGTHRAIERYQYYAQRFPYVLKCDVRKFFPSLDHQILKQALRWKIACADTLWLVDLIIDNSNPQEKLLQWFPADDLFTPLERRKGLLPPDALEASLNAWLGHVRFGDSERWEKEVFSYLSQHGVELFKHPRGSWRVLEQQQSR